MDLSFEEGTLVLREIAPADSPPPEFDWDPRRDVYRAQALDYRAVVTRLRGSGIDYTDSAKDYHQVAFDRVDPQAPREYQAAAIEAWAENGNRGITVLPTGSGKSLVGVMAISRIGRSTLVVAPTIDLMNQWYDLLCEAFADVPVGLMGGGYHEIRELTVATYHSAYLHVEQWGNRFGRIIFDEVHHLPGPQFSHAAEMCLAPYRLGLTATLERPDGRHQLLDRLVGPVSYRQEIQELAGEYLASYRVERKEVQMVAEERVAYRAAEAEYRFFLRAKNVTTGSAAGWQEFVRLSGSSAEGRRAMKAYREHRRIALGAAAKFEVLESILKTHSRDRVIIFTQDNETVYQISRALLIPAITHQTRTRERREILRKFNRGDYLAVLTSKVLNEGVNVPEANVAVVLSGSATIREHVQRLGRILRPREGKEAVLYEVVTKGTMEKEVSRRRRQHSAYASAAGGQTSGQTSGPADDEQEWGDGPAGARADAS